MKRPQSGPSCSLPSPGVEIREVGVDEWKEAGRVTVAAYRALPGAHLDGGYAAELADVERRAREAVVLVAVDNPGGGVVGCVTYVPGPDSALAEGLTAGEAGIRMLAVAP